MARAEENRPAGAEAGAGRGAPKRRDGHDHDREDEAHDEPGEQVRDECPRASL